MIPNPWVVLGILATLLGAYGVGNWRGHTAERAKWELAIAVQKKDAAELLAAETAHVRELEQALDRYGSEVGTKHATLIAEIDAAYADNVRLRKRLRDPAGRGGSCNAADGGNSGAAGVHEGAAPGCQLSESVTGRLFGIARDADRDATIAASCMEYAEGLREILNDRD